MMHNGEIINVKLSAAEDKLATTGVDKQVKVYTWPSTKSCLEVKYNGPVKVRVKLFIVYTVGNIRCSSLWEEFRCFIIARLEGY